jgi:dUTP pyrophosphatase
VNDQEAAELRSVLWKKPTVKVAGPGQLPTRAHPGDAGFDLYVAPHGALRILPGEFARFDCQLHVQPPVGHWLMVVGRSSTFGKGLLVNVGVVDSGYRGPLVVDCRNISDREVRVEAGDRLAQMIPIGLVSDSVVLERVESLDPSERGSNGFGSSGR